MTEADALQIVNLTLWVLCLCAGPPILGAMLIGLVVALFQALTQIQESTLTFVPKIIVIFLVLSLSGSFIGTQLYAFTEQLYKRIETGF